MHALVHIDIFSFLNLSIPINSTLQ